MFKIKIPCPRNLYPMHLENCNAACRKESMGGTTKTQGT